MAARLGGYTGIPIRCDSRSPVSGAAESETRPASESEASAPAPAGLGRVRDLLIAKPELIRNDPGLMRAPGRAAHRRQRAGLRPPPPWPGWRRPALVNPPPASRSKRIARANFAAQAETHAAIVDILEARNNADLARRVNEAATDRFGLVAGLIAAEGTGPVPAGWRTLPPAGVDLILGPEGLARLGPTADAEALFGPAAGEVRSMAVVRMAIWADGRPGALAFGSAQADGFRPDMGAELVAFLARVVERTAERWPPAA